MTSMICGICNRCGKILSIKSGKGELSLVCSSCGVEVKPEPEEQERIWGDFLEKNHPLRFKPSWIQKEPEFQGVPVSKLYSGAGQIITI